VRGRNGLQAEVLLSLAVLFTTATAVFGVVLVRSHEARARQLRPMLARMLEQEARSPLAALAPVVPGQRWWLAEPEGAFRPQGAMGHAIDGDSRALAEEARARGVSLLRPGLPWQPTRFAAPLPGRGVAVAWLPPAIRAGPLLALVAADVLVLTAFGAFVLRRRMVAPLERLSRAARSVADGDLGARAPAEGAGEVAAVAAAFNEMTEALERRTGALEKAVHDLRWSNRHLREARAGLDRAERLAAVGRLAAGVAHEVGNPMGALLAFLDLARRDPGLSEQGRAHLDRGAREGERVRGILRQLLEFSHPRRGGSGPVDVASVCREMADLVRAQRRYRGVAVELDAEPDAPAAWADRGAVSQIVLNLLLNAADALRAGVDDPRIRVSVRGAPRAVRAGESDAASAARRRHADAVECVVADNGPGVDEADRERIFDPFFTTKPPGEGTGLGLANAARLAEELGGELALLPPAAEGGAAFALRLPVAAAEAGPVRAREDAR